MRISEYTLLEEAWDRSFGFMLNRIEDAKDEDSDLHRVRNDMSYVGGRCFSEFIIALEEMGVELDTVGEPLSVTRKRLPPGGPEE